jgi:hypothetical protein
VVLACPCQYWPALLACQGKPLFKGAAVEELAHYLRDDGPQKPVAGLKTCPVAGAKGVEVPFQALPEGGNMGLARSELHEQLRKTYEINFAANAMDTLRQLSTMRVDLVFFSVKGWAAYPMIHCANRNAYAADIDFDDALQRFYQDDPDSFYQPETFHWLVSGEEITDVFNHFDERDRNRFAETTGWILQHGHFDQVVHIGHDRRPRLPPAP